MLVANTAVAPAAGVKLPCSLLSAADTARTGISCPCYDLLLGTKTESPHLHTIHAHTPQHAHTCMLSPPPQKKNPLSLCLRTGSSLRSMTFLREYNFMDKPEGFRTGKRWASRPSIQLYYRSFLL